MVSAASAPGAQAAPRPPALWIAIGLCVVGSGCKPEFNQRNSQVNGARILAVQSVPAEADPDGVASGQTPSAIEYHALLVDPAGTEMGAPIDWAYCTRRKLDTDLNDVSAQCFSPATDPTDGGSALLPLAATGTTVTGKLPTTACALFGPNPPPEQGGRPADPDATGGYYQPIRLLVPSAGAPIYAAGETRLFCNLSSASQQNNKAFTDHYLVNENPEIAETIAYPASAPAGVALVAGTPLGVGLGEDVRISVGWAACPTAPLCAAGACAKADPCTGAETYIYYDLATQTLVSRRESLRVSWFANAGSFRDERTGRAEDELEVTTENVWTAPQEATTVHLWIVLHDSRGGVSWQAFDVVAN